MRLSTIRPGQELVTSVQGIGELRNTVIKDRL